MKTLMIRAHEIAKQLEGNYSVRLSMGLKQAWSEKNNKPSMTFVELAAEITKSFVGCYATTNGASVEIVYRGKKSDKIFISNGSVSKIGGWQVGEVAGKIADKYNFKKNF